MDSVPVVLEVEIELAVDIFERASVDAAAEVRLADDRLRIAVDERAERVCGGGDADALHVFPLIARGVIEQVAVTELYNFRRPGEAGLSPTSELRKRVALLAVGVTDQDPMDQVLRHCHWNIRPVVRRVGDELATVQKDECIGEILTEHGDE